MHIKWMNDIEELKAIVGSDTVMLMQSARHLCRQTADGKGYLLSFRYVSKADGHEDCQVSVYAEKKTVCFVCCEEECRAVAASVADETSGGKWLAGFLTALTEADMDFLEQLEENITEIEDGLLTETGTANRITRKIIAVRRDLLNRKRYYGQLEMILSELSSDTNGFFEEETRMWLALVDKRLDRLMSAVLHLQEYVSQVREAYQAQIDIEQNNIMRIFTVITSICLPLSLIAGWYGMNLMMPEYTWPFGYPLVLTVSAVVVIVCYIIFKRKKWF